MRKELSKTTKGIGDYFSTLSIYKKIMILVFITILLISNISIKVLVAQDYKNKEYIESWKIKNGTEFTVEYTHSVERTPVIENYIVKGKDIILLDAYFSSLGAGLPATTDYKFELLEDGFRLYDINEKIDYLVYRTGAVRANHILYINNKEYEFLDFTNPRTGVEFNIKKLRLLSYLIREGFN